MVKVKIIFGLFCVVFLLSGNMAKAAEWLDCPALSEDSSYKERESLKYLVPGQDGWLFISKKDFMTDFVLREASIEAFQKFQKKLHEKGTELVLVVVPQRGLFHADKIEVENFDITKARQNFKNMIEQLQQAGLPVNNSPDFENTQVYGYERDHHWNVHGAKLIAQETANAIKKIPIYSEIEKQEFVIEKGKEIYFKGSFYNPIKDICGIELPVHKIKEQVSVSKNDDLFGDSKTNIVLVGTSFSEQGKSFANFVGHLRVELSADIENRSIGGGGVSKSLLEYLKSEDFKNNPPKILIWEMPGFYNLNRKSLLKKAVKIIDNHE